ncbi:Ribosomal large subunit pseudouridine synthase D [Phycisphaerales bacterium]|nr:Ribosomal large subunit pseudouridine synthase D [Phycisphaerales bacterium]
MSSTPTNPGPFADDEASAAGLVLPGGKVDADAVRRAVEKAEELGLDDDAELRTVTFRIQRDLNKRLDKYLTDRIGFLSRTQLQKLIDEGGVLVNDRQPKASTKVGAGDVVEVVIPAPPEPNIQPEDIPLDVLFEDEHLIVLNKQPDIIVHPARSHLKGTLLSALAFHFRHRSKTGGGLSAVGEEFARPGVVHRLDRHTSGCIVFAKTDEAHWKLAHQFEHRRVDKRYLAVTHGHVEPDVQVIELPIGPHPSREKGYREKYVVRHDELGKHAVTICRVRERYAVGDEPRASGGLPGGPVTDSRRYSLVELELKTGRTHQIRVHLSYHLWPIVGDDMYGGKPYRDETGVEVIARQALHACTLGFQHPVSGEALEFTAPLRGDIAALVLSLRRMGTSGPITAPGATVDLSKAVGADSARVR